MNASNAEQGILSQTCRCPSTCLSSKVFKTNGQRKTRLPNGFSPGKYAVLCGRGSKCTKSPGNRRLRQLVNNHLRAYSEAKNKVEKTFIVTAIVHAVKQESPNGAFLKFDDGCWWEVEEAFAREKIGCLFRDSLHMQYKSSTKAKIARKKATDHPSLSITTTTTTTARNPSASRHQQEQGSMNTFLGCGSNQSEKTFHKADMKRPFGSSFRNRSSRPDFLKGCMSQFDQVMRGGGSPTGQSTNNDCQAEPGSVLRRACSIIEEPRNNTVFAHQHNNMSNSNSNNMSNSRYDLESGDLPDDLSDISDIFDEELLEDDVSIGFLDKSPDGFHHNGTIV